MSVFTITFYGGLQDGEERDLGTRSFLDLPREVIVRGELYLRTERSDTPGRLAYVCAGRAADSAVRPEFAGATGEA
jgi:hypothetical protein